jgi:hypothetical protein
MDLLLRLYGWPHEALHVLALWLIGRRPRAVARLHVDIPDDLTTRQYVFVAGLPALVFGIGAALGIMTISNAASIGQAALGLVMTLVMGIGAAGTVGDIQQIALRLAQDAEPRTNVDDDTADEKDSYG